VERFWSKVARGAPDECWPWLGARAAKGYGLFWWNGRMVKAHRVAFFLEHGRWPEPCGLHRCDHPACCNPSHVRDGTPADNAQERNAKGRHAHGARAGNARLDDTQALAILARRGEPSTVVAAAFDTSAANVRSIWSGRRWAHLQLT
jgi:hypothetical protein